MVEKKVAVVVVGEVGRNPRTLHHVLELAASGLKTEVLDLSRQAPELPPHVGWVRLRALSRVGSGRGRVVFLLGSGVRMVLVFLELATQLIRTRPTHILVQNPPSFPTLMAAWLAARVGGARWLVDWHNYGFSMLALRLGDHDAFVKLAAAYEGWMGRRADGHLCVSRAMANDLWSRFGIAAEVLYPVPLRIEEPEVEGGDDGVLVAVSPCGWTADEPVDVLLDALALLAGHPLRDRFRFHLTGDGPLRAGYEPRIAELRKSGFAIHTGFLSEADYWAVIRSATVGISLHDSASGLDLAMKNVDLMAAHVPVCAFDYGGSLPEQIREGENGYLFRTAEELACLLQSFAESPEQLLTLKQAMRARGTRLWGSEWNRVALPSLLDLAPPLPD